MIVLRIAVVIIGAGFFLPGFVGVFRPERLGELLQLTPDSPDGFAALRVLIGAPYLAMAVTTIYAAVRRQWAWLAPVAAIEGSMAVTRVFSAYTDGFAPTTLLTLAIETIVCVVLSLGAILPARSVR